jgi:hypothetical protein
MKNFKTIGFVLFIFISCKSDITKYNCENFENVKQMLKQKCNSDVVEISYKVLQEEMYFPKIRAIIIIINNPTFEVIDFKGIEYGNENNNYYLLKSKIHEELRVYSDILNNKCPTKNIDKIIFRIVNYKSKEDFDLFLTIDFKILKITN